MTPPPPQRTVSVPVYVLMVGLAMVVLSPILAIVASTKISERSLAESNRKWCSLVITLDDAYKETPPTTAAGKNVAESLHRLRGELGCPGG